MQEEGLHSRHSSHRGSSVLMGAAPAMHTPLPRQDQPNIGNSGLRAQIQLPTGGTMVRHPSGFCSSLRLAAWSVSGTDQRSSLPGGLLTGWCICFHQEPSDCSFILWPGATLFL